MKIAARIVMALALAMAVTTAAEQQPTRPDLKDFPARLVVHLRNEGDESLTSRPTVLSVKALRKVAADVNPHNCVILASGESDPQAEMPHQVDVVDEALFAGDTVVVCLAAVGTHGRVEVDQRNLKLGRRLDQRLLHRREDAKRADVLVDRAHEGTLSRTILPQRQQRLSEFIVKHGIAIIDFEGFLEGTLMVTLCRR